MRFEAPYRSCSCRTWAECTHDNEPLPGPEKHTLTSLVTAFSAEMRRVMHEQVDDGNGGWSRVEWTVEDIKAALIAHVEKGDPVDVANFCAFWWNRLEANK